MKKQRGIFRIEKVGGAVGIVTNIDFKSYPDFVEKLKNIHGVTGFRKSPILPCAQLFCDNSDKEFIADEARNAFEEEFGIEKG